MKTVKELCESGIIVNNGQMHYFENVEDAVREYEAINKK
jgi:ABC-type polysaccharide/polyol phosphate transport system ATPase subunit